MKKKILWFLPILLFVFLFGGCSETQTIDTSNAIVFSIAINSEGGISQTISLPTQEDQFVLKKEEKENYIKDLTMEIKRKLFFPYYYNYFTISAISAGPENKLGGEKVSFTQPIYDEQQKTISFSFDFVDSEVWEIYHPNEREEDEELEIEKSFFINIGKSENNFIFAEKMSAEGEEIRLGEYFHNTLSTTQSKHNLTILYKPQFIYVYSHFSGKIHTNADKKVDNSGQKVNAWIQDFEQLGEAKNIEVFVYSPNRAVWYGVALGGTVLAMTITWAIHAIIEKKKEKREKA